MITTTIFENLGLWTITATDGFNIWSRHARSQERAEEIASDLRKLAERFSK